MNRSSRTSLVCKSTIAKSIFRYIIACHVDVLSTARPILTHISVPRLISLSSILVLVMDVSEVSSPLAHSYNILNPEGVPPVSRVPPLISTLPKSTAVVSSPTDQGSFLGQAVVPWEPPPLDSGQLNDPGTDLATNVTFVTVRLPRWTA